MGATVEEWAMMYKAVAQTVLLYGSKSWVVMEAMRWTGGYQGFQIENSVRGMVVVIYGGIFGGGGDVAYEGKNWRWQTTIAEYIKNRPIY